MFYISFSFLHLLPRGGGGMLRVIPCYTLLYIGASKTSLIFKNIFNRLQN